jgi:hypothetical protein
MRDPQALHKEADRARFYVHLIRDEEAVNRAGCHGRGDGTGSRGTAQPGVAVRTLIILNFRKHPPCLSDSPADPLLPV